MHVRSLDIQNFRAISKLPIQFEDGMGRFRPITVIAGPNGSGKTSILFGIMQALRGAMHLRLPDVPDPSEADLHRVVTSSGEPATASVELDLEYDTLELDAIRRVFAATAESRRKRGKQPLKPPQLPDGTLKVRWQNPQRIRRDGTKADLFDLESDPLHGAVWLSAFYTAWRAWKDEILNDITQTYPIGGLKWFPQNRVGRWGVEVDDADDSSEFSSSSQSANNPQANDPGEYKVTDSLETLWRLRHNSFVADIDDRKNWESLLQERFRRVCSPKEYKGFDGGHPRYGKSPILAHGKHEYPYSRASGGERVILDYLTQLTFPHPVRNSIILIDEPELHLHPHWMRQLFQLFAQSAKPIDQGGDNNQFIMTTHSPELRKLADRENALFDLGDLVEEDANAG